MEISESNERINEDFRSEINERIFKKIPTFIFGKNIEPRTMIFEDFLGYNIIKFFYTEDKISFLLIRIEGKFYSNDEIKKFSLKINQYLDIKLIFSILLEKIHEIFINIETYDFSRPIKLKQLNFTLIDKYKSLKIDELLPKINKLRSTGKLPDILESYVLQTLLSYQKRKINELTTNFDQIYNKLMNFLEKYSGTELDQYDLACIFFNFGLIFKELGFLEESNDAFSKATARFQQLQIDNLRIFSFFNMVLNLKQLKKFDSALDKMLEVEKSIIDSIILSNGFKGIFFRHLGELFQLRKEFEVAKNYFNKSLTYLEKDKQINIDTALNYLALGTINYNESEYFGASKYFSYAANILSLLNQDIIEVTKNLGLSLLNFSIEYLKGIKILLIEKDYDRVMDLLLKGVNYLILSNFHLGNQLIDKFKESYNLYLKLLEKTLSENSKQGDREIGNQIGEILKEQFNKLNDEPDLAEIKKMSKKNYENVMAFQPIKSYYFMIIYKDKGLPIFSKTSTTLKDLPTFDSDLIAGLITAMNSFLEEVLTGNQNLSLIDRDNIKIIFENSPHLIGIMFLNRENPQIRMNLKNILLKLEELYKKDFENWNGETSKFNKIEEITSKIIK